MHSDKKAFVELVVVLALIGLGLWSLRTSPPTAVNTVEDTTPAGGTSATGSSPAQLSYAQALVKFKDARLQLNDSCQASPNNMTFKNNSLLMIDNRAAVARTVKVGSTFSVKGYGFEIVKLTSATLPATWYVDCGTSQNVATIYIQK